jgi:Flp pilus assembly protein TadG
MIIRLARIRDCERGASLLEFALAAPFLAMLLLGMVDVSRAYSDRLMLEQAAQRAIEKVEQQHSVSSDYNSLQAEVASAAGVPNGNVTVDFWLECNGTRQSSFTGACTNGEAYRRYVTVSVQKSFTPFFGTPWFTNNGSGGYTLTADAGIRVQ